MKKKIKNTIKERIVSKSAYAELFTDQRTRLDTRLNEEAIQNLGIDIIKWIENDENILTMEQIYSKLGILPFEFLRLREKYKCLENASKFCLMLLSIRRQLGGYHGKLNAGLIERSMPLYSDDWKKLVEWRADLQSKVNAGYQTINVQMNPIPNSELVPVKKSESLDVGE